MHEHLRDGGTADVRVLHFFRRHVLALRQLEDVLLPVDDLHRALLQKTYFSAQKVEFFFHKDTEFLWNSKASPS